MGIMIGGSTKIPCHSLYCIFIPPQIDGSPASVFYYCEMEGWENGRWNIPFIHAIWFEVVINIIGCLLIQWFCILLLFSWPLWLALNTVPSTIKHSEKQIKNVPINQSNKCQPHNTTLNFLWYKYKSTVGC